MGKFSKKIAKEIIDFIELDMYTITEICNILNISRKTFYNWLESDAKFRKEVEDAKERAEEKLLMEARRALRSKLERYKVEETVITYVPDENEPTGFRIKKKVVKIKDIPPSSKDIERVIERADRKERIRKQKDEAKPSMSFADRVEQVKRQYGYYEILKKIHKDDASEEDKFTTGYNRTAAVDVSETIIDEENRNLHKTEYAESV